MSLVGWTSLAGAAVLGAGLAGGCSSSGGAGPGGGSSTGTITTTTSSDTGSSSSSSSGTGGAGPVYEPSGFSCSTKKRSLTTDVVPITQSSCSNAACHLAMQSGSGVVDQLVNRIAEECSDLRMMVNPGDPEGSYVIHKLTNHNLCSPATTMPLNGATLPASEIQTIYDWICEGAPSN